MTMVSYILIGMTVLIISIYVIGLILPPERVFTREENFDTTPEVVYDIVTNNDDFFHRSDLKDVIIVSHDNGFEVWDEISKNGSVMRLKTTEKCPYSSYSFDIKSTIFTGYWKGEFKPKENGSTFFKMTECIRVHNPFIKIFSYFFLNIDKLLDSYQNDLRKKINAMKYLS